MSFASRVINQEDWSIHCKRTVKKVFMEPDQYDRESLVGMGFTEENPATIEDIRSIFKRIYEIYTKGLDIENTDEIIFSLKHYHLFPNYKENICDFINLSYNFPKEFESIARRLIEAGLWDKSTILELADIHQNFYETVESDTFCIDTRHLYSLRNIAKEYEIKIGPFGDKLIRTIQLFVKEDNNIEEYENILKCYTEKEDILRDFDYLIWNKISMDFLRLLMKYTSEKEVLEYITAKI